MKIIIQSHYPSNVTHGQCQKVITRDLQTAKSKVNILLLMLTCITCLDFQAETFPPQKTERVVSWLFPLDFKKKQFSEYRK